MGFVFNLFDLESPERLPGSIRIAVHHYVACRELLSSRSIFPPRGAVLFIDWLVDGMWGCPR